MLKALFALVTAALFAGAALSLLLSGRPAERERRQGSGSLLETLMALLSLVLGAWAWWKTGDNALLIGALLVGAVVPLDYLGGARRPGLRALLGVAAVIAYLFAFLWP